jgi:hypothetical protein
MTSKVCLRIWWWLAEWNHEKFTRRLWRGLSFTRRGVKIWVMTVFQLISGYQRFGRTCCFHLSRIRSPRYTCNYRTYIKRQWQRYLHHFTGSSRNLRTFASSSYSSQHVRKYRAIFTHVCLYKIRWEICHNPVIAYRRNILHSIAAILNLLPQILCCMYCAFYREQCTESVHYTSSHT